MNRELELKGFEGLVHDWDTTGVVVVSLPALFPGMNDEAKGFNFVA